MYVLVMYDVPDDRPRRKLAQRCKDFGLRRAQKSVFMGHADAGRRAVLCEVLERTLAGAPGLVHVLPVDRRSLENLKVVFNPPEDDDEVIDDVDG